MKAIDFRACGHLEDGSTGRQLALCAPTQKPGPPAVQQALAEAQAHPSYFTWPVAVPFPHHTRLRSLRPYGQDQIRWSPSTGLLAPEKWVSRVLTLN